MTHQVMDVVYGPITIPSLCQRIMDTPTFQRLRNLNQMGCASRVFPNAVHKRFEHSIGVMHLGGLWAEHLKSRQPELNITEADVLCVQIAGLCHDLGHGPFSHTFDSFAHNVQSLPSGWCHEQQSCLLLQRLIIEHGIQLEDFGLDPHTDLQFILEMIGGDDTHPDPKARIGRIQSQRKEFLYDIVSNSVSGLDVDKMDYFIRDKKNTTDPGAKCDAILHLLRTSVVKENHDVLERDILEGYCGDSSHHVRRLHICFPQDAAQEVLSLFETRAWLHNGVYGHTTSRGYDFMLCDVLEHASEVPLIYARGDGGGYVLKTIVQILEDGDLDAYTRLDDRILALIANNPDPRLDVARDLLRRMDGRRVYKCVGKCPLQQQQQQQQQQQPQQAQLDAIERAEEALYSIANRLSRESKVGVTLQRGCARKDSNVGADLILDVVKIHHGKKQRNPVDFVRFFEKGSKMAGATKLPNHVAEANLILPLHFQRVNLQVFCRSSDPRKIEIAKRAFAEYISTST